MKITIIGIDLAKEVFQIHGVDIHGKAVLRKQLSRSKLTQFFADLEPCLIGMEACGSSHHWARKLSEFGHIVKLMSRRTSMIWRMLKQFVKRSADRTCDLFRSRILSNRQFCQHIVPDRVWLKPELPKQTRYVACFLNSVLLFHKVFIRLPNGCLAFWKMLKTGLPGTMRRLLSRLSDHFKELGLQVEELELQIQLWHKENEASQRLEAIAGIGPVKLPPAEPEAYSWSPSKGLFVSR